MRFLLNPISGQLNAAPSKEIVYSETAPFAPLEGLRWADTTNLREYIFIDGYWVEVGVGFVGPAPSGTGAVVVSNGILQTPIAVATANTASTIVQRDASGNFSAGTITANLTGSVSGNAANVTGTVAIANGGTGSTTAPAALIALGAAATSHTHGSITNAGAIGTTASLPIITGTSGVLQAGAFGTTTGTFCQGNDTRLSDARTPTSHTHDDRYYTETEINTLLTGKQSSGSYVLNGGSVSSITKVTAMPTSPDANTLYIVIP